MEETIPRARVWVLNVNPGQVSTEFSNSLLQLHRADIDNGWGLFSRWWEARSGPNVAKARNDLVAEFLRGDGDWALFLDSDMVFPPDTMIRLLSAAKQADTKIIGGLCVAEAVSGPVPTIYQRSEVAVTFQHTDYPENTLLQVSATGAACLMVHRDVFEAMQAAHQEDGDYCWFQEQVIRGRWVSEDIWFCLRAGELGYPVYVDTTLEIGHVKHGRVMWPSDIKTPASLPPHPIVAVIPTKGALDEDGNAYVEGLVRQLHEQGEATEIVVIDNDGHDERITRGLGGVTVLAGDGMGIHEMWNLGAEHAVRHGHRTHIAFLNDDLRIGPGFLRSMSRALDSHPELVAVSGNYDHRDPSLATIGLPHEPVQEVYDICANRYDGTGGLAGFAFMALGGLFTSGYRFPEECKWWYGDNDLVATVLAGKGKVGIAIRAEVDHLDGGGRTAGDWGDEAFAEVLAADRRAFEARWERQRVKGDFAELYRHVCESPSDINEHLPTLYRLATEMKAQDIIELGTRTGVSTVAWCHAAAQTDGRVWAVDITDRLVFTHPQLTFIVGDDLAPETLAQLPEQADIVFVDTLHSYEQTTAEIDAYKARVRPGGCMVFHDTAVEVHEHLGADQPKFPTRLAVDEWVEAAGLRVERWENNNGLSVVWLPEAAA